MYTQYFTVCENSRNSLSNPRAASQTWKVDSDWSKAHVIHNGLYFINGMQYTVILKE